MTQAELKQIVSALRENDKQLNTLFEERELLVKGLSAEEKDKIHRKLYSDGESHFPI